LAKSIQKVSCYNLFMKILILWAGLFSLLLASSWNLVKEKEGVSVYTREVNGSDFLEFKGVVEVPAPLDAVVAFLYDIPRTPEWINDCDFGMTLEEVSFYDNYIYQTFDLPFPVSDRALILHSILTYTEEGARLDSVASNDFCKHRDDERCMMIKKHKQLYIQQSKGVYRLISLDQNRTKIIWRLHTEPGGYIPSWLANSLVVALPFNSLKALRELVQEPRYYTMTREALEALWKEAYLKRHKG